MKKFISEFKDFIATGNLIELAVALVIGLKVKDVIDNFMAGIVDPIIAAIIGKGSLKNAMTVEIGDATLLFGLVLDALINLVIVGLVLFVILKAYNKMRKPAAPAAPSGPTEVELLTEIRDSLRNR